MEDVYPPRVTTPDLAELILPIERGEILTTESTQLTTTTITKPPCQCKFNDGKPCHTLFPPTEIADCQIQYIALERGELDMAILAKIQCGFHNDDLNRSTKKSSQTQRTKVRLDYFHHGHKICRQFFLHLHQIGKDKLDALIAHFKLNGIEARGHKNAKRLPSKSLRYEDTRRVVDFIVNYANINAIELPGRTPKHWVTNAKLLPTNTTKRLVYDNYQTDCEANGHRAVKLRTFRKLWQQLLPFVRTMPPASDLCWTCQDGTNRIARAANKSLEVKRKLVQELERHHQIVDQERKQYQRVVQQVKEQLPADSVLRESVPCSFNGSNHLSFDFAQQVHFPYDPLQPGPIYFKTPRKCGLFGINCEPLSRQVNYLIDESHSCGKGANVVISYIHHFLDNYGLGEMDLFLHADNCAGQNKNSFMIWYLLWRCVTNRHRSITLNFLITGHTKFSPDAGFGLIKRKFRRARIDCLEDIETVVKESSSMNLSQLVGPENGTSNVTVYDWSSFLSRCFRKVKNIKSFHQFVVDASGVLTLKVHSAAEPETQNIMLHQPTPTDFPPVIKPNGLSNQRQWYLYKEIRPFVKPEFQDIVAPKPSAPEVEEQSSDDEEILPPPAKQPKRKPSSTRGRGGKSGRLTTQ